MNKIKPKMEEKIKMDRGTVWSSQGSDGRHSLLSRKDSLSPDDEGCRLKGRTCQPALTVVYRNMLPTSLRWWLSARPRLLLGIRRAGVNLSWRADYIFCRTTTNPPFCFSNFAEFFSIQTKNDETQIVIMINYVKNK